MVTKRLTWARRKNSPLRGTFGDRVFGAVCVTLILIITVACLYPVLNVLAKSLSDKTEVAAARVNGIIPRGITLDSFALVVNSPRFITAIKNSGFITLVATALNIVLTFIVAYAVSRQDFPLGKYVMLAYIFTMMFSGGLIPTYLAVQKIGLYNSLWAIIIPNLVVTYYLVLMRNFISGLPKELEEAAMIDGASQIKYLVRIVAPLSMPSLATIMLFCAVDAWNCYFNAIIYLSSRDLVVLQVYLREILMSIQTTEMNTIADSLLEGLPAECIRCACVVACALPITLVYPFLQKYYVKGMTLGAVKG